ncbi:hypothetical protein CHLNCDRAFT_138033 [Chlorella variabilis]|uniref:Calcineurin-like phosphoesterase domain-containing protein n=1 Tax=Chlorella variabilis TaxID=554065 RepID=E1Z539_CHLVA|nr:hypothetical protein CHLNCDRAFT_138033 [Chlorella variabilis]EFN59457.1 hypothetical protein CHLNCDRAFT_138033 [Chlorella variabilis]|eukprot:XP_005851559.1 hypothetical protein CHLNCDRAFT_138033 [Chlorella variabilis]
MAAEQRPLFSFGCIADAQYADLEDGDTEGRSQLYRQVPGKLRAALAELRAARPRVQLVLHLGDIVNGNAAGQAQCDREFDLVASIFDQELGGDVPALHVVGNHCLSVPREVLVKRLGIPETCYYSRSLGSGWRLVVLDTTEMSGHSGHAPGSRQHREAQEFLASHPMSDEDPQMSSWNGGITRQQLAWLRSELAAAEAAAERVIIASHHQLGQGGARATHMAWNWRDVQQVVLLASPAFRLALAGHDHMGGCACINGRHFVTLEALLEAPPGSNAFAVLHVFGDRIRIAGSGSVTSRELAV